MKKCDVINISNKKHCNRKDVARHTMQDGSQHDVCTFHFNRDKEGSVLSYHTFHDPKPTTAVLSDENGTVHIRLQNGMEVEQPTLFAGNKENKNMDPSNSRVMKIMEEGKVGVHRVEENFVIAGTGSRSLQKADTEVKTKAKDIVTVALTANKEKYGDRLVVMSGMAEGFDKLLAFVAIELGIKLWCAVPNRGYADYYWARNSLTGQNQQAAFDAILSNAWKVTYIREDVYNKSTGLHYKGRHYNFVRNDFMVEHANAFLVWDPSSRGTADCLKSVIQAGLPYKVLSQ